MTKHEQVVRARFPRATVERQKRNDGTQFFIVRREIRATMYLATGNTKVQAWKNAAEAVQGMRREPTPPEKEEK